MFLNDSALKEQCWRDLSYGCIIFILHSYCICNCLVTYNICAWKALLQSSLGNHKLVQKALHHESLKQFLSNQQHICRVMVQSPVNLRHPSTTTGANTTEKRCYINILKSWANFELFHVLDSIGMQWRSLVNAEKTRSSWKIIFLRHNLANK